MTSVLRFYMKSELSIISSVRNFTGRLLLLYSGNSCLCLHEGNITPVPYKYPRLITLKNKVKLLLCVLGNGFSFALHHYPDRLLLKSHIRRNSFLMLFFGHDNFCYTVIPGLKGNFVNLRNSYE